MNIVGQAVRHKQYGVGQVLTQEGELLKVRFPQVGEKSFLFPRSFESHLTLEDETLQTQVMRRVAALQEQQRRERESRRLEEQQRREEEHQQALEKEKLRKRGASAAKRAAVKAS